MRRSIPAESAEASSLGSFSSNLSDKESSWERPGNPDVTTPLSQRQEMTFDTLHQRDQYEPCVQVEMTP